MIGVVRVVDELRDFDVDIPADSPSIDFPDTRSRDYYGWDRHGIHSDLDKAWCDAEGAHWASLLCSRKSGAVFMTVERVRPVSERRPGERCLVVVRSPRVDGHGPQQFWPCFVELAGQGRSPSGPG